MTRTSSSSSVSLDAKAKSAFTRAYTRGHWARGLQPASMVVKKKSIPMDNMQVDDDYYVSEDDEEEVDVSQLFEEEAQGAWAACRAQEAGAPFPSFGVSLTVARAAFGCPRVVGDGKTRSLSLLELWAASLPQIRLYKSLWGSQETSWPPSKRPRSSAASSHGRARTPSP